MTTLIFLASSYAKCGSLEELIGFLEDHRNIGIRGYSFSELVLAPMYHGWLLICESKPM